VLTQLSEWLDHRTRYRSLRDALLLEHIPGGARWRYVWGSTLAFVFLLQLVTGVLLMTAYSASESTAWSSVYFIQYEMDFGWLIRGLHHFGSQTMVVLLGLHMLQVVIAGAHLPPREVNWWLGLVLLGGVLGLSLTGYLLPWDQKGYWATQVATNIAGNLPVLGPWLQKVIVGGPEYGHHTLTRFYALHVGILPPLLIVFIIAHLAVFRRHGVTAPKTAQGTVMFWPDQAFRDLLVCLMVFGVMLTLVLFGHGHGVAAPADGGWYEDIAHAGQRGLGANLDAPADPARPYPARPEWYFLFLFQLLKYFEGDQEIIGTVAIPAAVGLLLFLLPVLGFGKLRRFGHIFGVLVILGLLTAVATLTCLAIADDTPDPLTRAIIRRIGILVIPAVAIILLLQLGLLSVLWGGRLRRMVYSVGVLVMAVLLVGTGSLLYAALDDREIPEPIVDRVTRDMTAGEQRVPQGVEKFQAERAQADKDAARALTLAREGVPEQGAKYLLRRDPMTRGPVLFKEHCAVCHRYTVNGRNEFPQADKGTAVKVKPPDLGGFGTEEWIHAFLLDPGSEHFFANKKRSAGAEEPKFTRMAQWVKDKRRKADPEVLAADFGKIAKWLASHPHGKEWKDPALTEGYNLFQTKYNCKSCHSYAGGKNRENAPDLTGYGSAEWIRRMVTAPARPELYGDNNEMPTFRNLETLTADLMKQEYAAAVKMPLNEIHFVHLNDVDRELIIRWLVGDSRVVFGGEAITGPPKNKE
jgi:quinol-cytochrome oxidoreductase complex cytochrome b subunit/mono/diheme cytochrome c family protein